MEGNLSGGEIHWDVPSFEIQPIQEQWFSSGANWTTPEVPTGYSILNNYNDDVTENQTSSHGNVTDPDVLPQYLLEMSPTSRNCVLAYMILFLISATGNLSVFVSVLQQLRKSKSRICVLILHLSIADLMVTFFVMPIEIFWRISVGWYGGNVLCKICQFLRAFGLYLSSMVLICISLDRYFAIIHPLRTSGAKRRGRTMLAVAWIVSALCSLPQSVIFRIKSHPDYPSFLQCVSLNFFGSLEGEVAYNVSSVFMMYFVPLLVIIFTYTCILYKIHKKSRQQRDSRTNAGKESGKILLRRIDARNSLERAKIRTLRLTLIIILVFVLCWTPYAVITLWYMFDREKASKLNPGVQEGLFLMAVANSCVNPLIYGSYSRECGEAVMRCCVSESSRRGRPFNRHSKLTVSYRCGAATTMTSTSLHLTRNQTQISRRGSQSCQLRMNISNHTKDLRRLSPSLRGTWDVPSRQHMNSNGHEAVTDGMELNELCIKDEKTREVL